MHQQKSFCAAWHQSCQIMTDDSWCFSA